MESNITAITTEFTGKQWLSVSDEITHLMRGGTFLTKKVSITFSDNGSPLGRIILANGINRIAYEFRKNGTLRRIG